MMQIAVVKFVCWVILRGIIGMAVMVAPHGNTMNASLIISKY